MADHMSLWMDLRVGKNAVIGRLEIIRTTGKGDLHPAPDAVYTYRVLRDGRQVAIVAHRYGDGAWALLRKALNALEETAPKTVHYPGVTGGTDGAGS
jgi:hypothetical protein